MLFFRSANNVQVNGSEKYRHFIDSCTIKRLYSLLRNFITAPILVNAGFYIPV